MEIARSSPALSRSSEARAQSSVALARYYRVWNVSHRGCKHLCRRRAEGVLCACLHSVDIGRAIRNKTGVNEMQKISIVQHGSRDTQDILTSEDRAIHGHYNIDRQSSSAEHRKNPFENGNWHIRLPAIFNALSYDLARSACQSKHANIWYIWQFFGTLNRFYSKRIERGLACLTHLVTNGWCDVGVHTSEGNDA